MDFKEIKHIIQNGEKIDVEFKESKNALTKDVFDTVCSFNNRNGGHILLGINDKREIVNVNARDRILREIVSNTLAHRDYSSGFPAKMIIDDKRIIIENSNIAHGMGILDLQRFEPFPKNPSISKVFREIGLADELGSGMCNTYKYTQLYSGENPIFEEGDIFRITIPLKRIATQKVGGENVSRNVSRMSSEELKNKIIEMIKKDKKVSRKFMAEELEVSEKTITRYIKEIPNVKYVGKGKNGYWEVD